MRTLLLSLSSILFVVFVSGCVQRQFTPYRTPHQIVVVVDQATLYGRDPVYPNRLGRPAGTYTGYSDTISCLGEMKGRVGNYYAVTVSGTHYWMEQGEVLSLYDYAVLIQALSFRLHNADDPIAWNRAAVFIAHHSPWPLALEGEYVIRTENLGSFLETEMILSRLRIGDSVEYHIAPSRLVGDNVPRMHLAKELAYFMRTSTQRHID